MSESVPETTEQAPEAPRTFTQDEVDRIVADRLKREGVRELKAKAARLDELENSSKTELDRLTEQIAQLTKAQAEAESRAVRYRVAAAHGITNEDADLFLTGGDEDTITAQAERLAARVAASQKPSGNYVPNEGNAPSKSGDSEVREFARRLFNSEE